MAQKTRSERWVSARISSWLSLSWQELFAQPVLLESTIEVVYV